MPQSSWTDGRWAFDPVEGEDKIRIFSVQCNGGKTNVRQICTVTSTEADANLIRAAPHMAKVLSALERWFDTDEHVLDALDADERRNHDEQLAAIRTALATASPWK